jgi:MFS family permease
MNRPGPAVAIGAPATAVPRRLPRTVIILGIVSFLNDAASDVVIPLIPILLATVLGSGPVALGLIEGIADAVASFLKLWSGRHSDRIQGRRKGLALAGYTLSNLARPLLGVATSWPAVLLLRTVDRMGKGIRSAPRDALVADVTPPDMRGYAFGFHRALDNAGALAGSLGAAAILAWSGLGLKDVMLWSALPGALAVLCLAWGVKEPAKPAFPGQAARLTPLAWRALAPPMRRYLLVLGLFTLARASETFILLLGHQLGIATVELLVLWAALNLAKALTSTWGGQLADRLGRELVLLVGWTAFSVSFLLFGKVVGSAGLWAVTIGYGLFMGLTEGAERAAISDYCRSEERGTAFGWYYLVLGLAAIPGGLAFGLIWAGQGASTAFFFASGLAAAAAVSLRLWAWPRQVRRAQA